MAIETPQNSGTSLTALRFVLRRLRALLKAYGYFHLLHCYGSDRVREGALRFDLPILPCDLRDLVSFFYLGDAIDRQRLSDLVSEEVAVFLFDSELAKEGPHGTASMGPVFLTSLNGVHLFCDRPSLSARWYIGDDSFALAKTISPRGRVLDLCAGVGLQTLVSGRTASSVVSVEIDSSASWLYQMNALLNECESKVELRVGDGFTPVAGERFDAIVCNPPLLAIPPSVSFPRAGDGGERGTEVALEILQRARDFLNPGGEVSIIGTLLGDSQGPFDAPLVDSAKSSGLHALAVYPFSVPLERRSSFYDALVRTASGYSDRPYNDLEPIFAAHFAGQHATHIYSFLLSATLCETEGRGSLSSTAHFARGAAFWSV